MQRGELVRLHTQSRGDSMEPKIFQVRARNQKIKHSTLAFIDKCGHMSWLEQPEQTWKIVDDFLARLP